MLRRQVAYVGQRISTHHHPRLWDEITDLWPLDDGVVLFTAKFPISEDRTGPLSRLTVLVCSGAQGTVAWYYHAGYIPELGAAVVWYSPFLWRDSSLTTSLFGSSEAVSLVLKPWMALGGLERKNLKHWKQGIRVP